jgi:hypothetical protein
LVYAALAAAVSCIQAAILKCHQLLVQAQQQQQADRVGVPAAQLLGHLALSSQQQQQQQQQELVVAPAAASAC